MRFFKEFDGFLWEFNSVIEFIDFIILRAILYVLVLGGIFWFLVWYGRSGNCEGEKTNSDSIRVEIKQ